MKWIAMVAMGMLAAGCAPLVPSAALQLSPTSLQDRQIQTRRFATSDEEKLQRASAQVLQDLGFQIDESETRLGVIVASKTLDVRDAGQVVRALLAARILHVHMPTDRLQRIRASLVTRPAGSSDVAVRITFQRLVWDSEHALSTVEGVNDPTIYQEFFDRLSQSVFLTAQGL
jgi:hypothetical protein